MVIVFNKYYMYLLTKSEIIYICMEYVWKSSLGIASMYISKSYTTTKNTIDRQHTEQGQLVSTYFTSNNY